MCIEIEVEGANFARRFVNRYPKLALSCILCFGHRLELDFGRSCIGLPMNILLFSGECLSEGLTLQSVEVVEDTVIFHAHSVRASNRCPHCGRPSACGTGATSALTSICPPMSGRFGSIL